MGSSAAVAFPGGVGARTRKVERAFKGVLDALGLDLTDPNLTDTPARVARAYGELFAGMDRPEPEMRTFPNTERYSQVVAVTGIPFYSLCAHHFLPFFGTAHVGYVPGDQVVGLSKLARVVDHFARRPQIQERLTEQIIGFLEARLAPRGAMVILEGRHFCMEMRGIAKPGAVTTTSAIRGAFEDERTRQEFLALTRRPA
jgi:GTP cyclohydrolase I